MNGGGTHGGQPNGPDPAGEEPDPAHRSPSSHRAPLGKQQLLGRALAPVAAIGVVVAVIALLVWINGSSSGTSSAALASPPPPTPPSIVPVTPPSSSPTTKPSRPASPTPSPTPTHHRPSPAAVHRHSSRPAPLTAMAPVHVLNNSRITGLAHAVAASVQEHGWHVVLIGNFEGLIPETTVYYAPGQHPAAVHLAHDFPEIARIEPNSAIGFTASGITLVITRHWVGE